MRLVPWTEPALMTHEDAFEALTAKAVQLTMKELRKQLLSYHRPLTAAAGDESVQLPAPPPQTAPPVSFTAVEGAVMATWTSLVDSELYPFLTDTFLQSAGRVVKGIKDAAGQAVEPLTNTYATEYLQYAHNRMVGIGQKLWEVLRAEMVEGFQAGEGIKEIAARLSHVGNLATPRALTTARTEVISAANGGSYAQMLAAGFDDTEVTKVWLATEDTRTRISHRHADNQGVELTGEFTLDIYKGDVKTGTEGLEFPGDPAGTPGNVINCRCSLAFDFTEDKENETPMTAASYFNEKLHPRDEHGKFTKKGSAGALFKALTEAEKLGVIKDMTKANWDKLSDEEKAAIAVSTAKIPGKPGSSATAKVQKFLNADVKANNAPKGWEPGDPTPTKDSSSLAKTQYIIHEKLGDLSGQQTASFIKAVKQDDWNDLTTDEKVKIGAAIDKLGPADKSNAQYAVSALIFGQGPKASTGNVKKDVENLVKKTPAPVAAKTGAPAALPTDEASLKNFKQGVAAGNLNKLSDDKAAQLIAVLQQEHWDALDDDEKAKVHKRIGNLKGENWDAARANLAKLDKKSAPAAGPARPQGGADTKTGKELVPGKPVKLRVQLLYNTTFADGAVMAVRKDSDERIVWQGGKVLRQKKGADGKFHTTETKTRGDAYKAWKDEDGWTVPAAASAPAGAPEAPTAVAAPSVGKPTSLKVQLIYQTPFEDGDTVAVNPGTGQKITWDAGKKRMVVHESDGSTKEYTRGALYKEFKDSKGWHLPGEASPATTPAAPAAPAAPEPEKDPLTKSILAKAGGAAGNPVLLSQGDGYQIWNVYGGTQVQIASEDGSQSIELDKAGLTDDALNKAIADVKAAVAAKPLTPGETIKKAYDTATPNKSFYDKDGVTMAKGTDGSVFIANKAGGNLAGLSAADATPDNFEKALEAVKAGNSWGINDPIPSTPVVANGADAFDAYRKTSASGVTKFYDHDGVKMMTGSDGSVLVGAPGVSAYGTLNKSDVTPENLEKAIAAVKAGHSWSSADPIPGTISAPATPSGAPSAAKVLGVVPDPADLKFTGKTVGTHQAKIYSGPGGSQYLFKPNPSGFKAGAEVDLATAKLHKELGFETPDTAIVSLDGQTGSLQKIVPNTTSANPKTFDASKLSPQEILDVQKEHIFDWLVANHDAHSDNLLKESGKPGLIGIDKGQAFKWFGQDKLSTTFNPNEHTQAANVLFEAYAKGVPGVSIVSPSSSEINDLLDKIQSMSDDEYKALLRPMAEAMAKDGKLGVPGPAHLGLKKPPFAANDVEGFLNAAVKRKNSIKNEMQAFYTGIIAQHNAALGVNAPTPPPVATPAALPNLPAPGMVPLNLSAAVLTGKKSTEYKHGQIIAVNPGENARLVWNDGAKKYQIQTQDPSGDWATVVSYNKSAALKQLKDDTGWHTPEPGKNFVNGSPPPTISGGSGTVAPVITPVSKPGKAKTKLAPASAQRISEADAEVAKLSAPQKTSLFDFFKKGGGSTIYLSSDAEKLFTKALETQVQFNKDHNTKLTALAVVRHVDAATAAKLGVANGNAYETKITDWLKTPKGAKKAAEILAESKMSPAEKVAAEAAKKAAAKAALDAKAKDLHAVPVSKPDVVGASAKFPVISIAKASELGTQMTAATPWKASETAALKKYTGYYYSELNGALRGNQPLTEQHLKDAINMQKAMRPLPENIVLHRGLNPVAGVLPGNIDEYKALIGKTFNEAGFTSTSVGGKAAFGGKISLTIEAPKGTPAAWVGKISQYQSEREMILASGSKFEILEAKMSPDGFKIEVRVRVVP